MKFYFLTHFETKKVSSLKTPTNFLSNSLMRLELGVRMSRDGSISLTRSTWADFILVDLSYYNPVPRLTRHQVKTSIVHHQILKTANCCFIPNTHL